MFSCDYNGWTDMPEEEREALDAFQAPRPLPVPQAVRQVLPSPLYLSPFPLTKAA